MMDQTPTAALSAALSEAFDHFNHTLFDGTLPACVVLLHRKPKTYGYFSPNRWEDATEAQFHEIALNPDYIKDRGLTYALSTLVHEQIHLWQQVFGSPCKRFGHNKEWADKMERLGLMPSSTGQEGGKKTGRKCSHYIIEGGLFDNYCSELLAAGFELNYTARPNGGEERKKRTKEKLYTYVCGSCEQKARAKEGVRLTCTECSEPMEIN